MVKVDLERLKALWKQAAEGEWTFEFVAELHIAFPALLSELEGLREKVKMRDEVNRAGLAAVEYLQTQNDKLQQRIAELEAEVERLKGELAEAKTLLRQAVMFATELEGFHDPNGDVCESEKRGHGSPCASLKAFRQFKREVERSGK